MIVELLQPTDRYGEVNRGRNSLSKKGLDCVEKPHMRLDLRYVCSGRAIVISSIDMRVIVGDADEERPLRGLVTRDCSLDLRPLILKLVPTDANLVARFDKIEAIGSGTGGGGGRCQKFRVRGGNSLTPAAFQENRSRVG